MNRSQLGRFVFFLILLEFEILSINNFSKHCKMRMQSCFCMTHICVGVQMSEYEYRLYLPMSCVNVGLLLNFPPYF